MKYGVLGTGMVGETLASKLVETGNEVMMGSRSANNPKALAWQGKAGARASVGTFADAASFGEMLFSCTAGDTCLAALRTVQHADVAGKVLVDVSNPLDFSKGGPPGLTIVNFDSLGESIQREFPEVKVVKALNTCNCQVMVKPSLVPGDHHLFICGNDAGAKAAVTDLVKSWGWNNIIDLGDITNARATEQLLPLWIRLYVMYKTPLFNFQIARASTTS